jgi:hypothetical protein
MFQCVVPYLIVLFYVLFVSIVLVYVLFVCKCVLYYCHRVATQLQLTNTSYRIESGWDNVISVSASRLLLQDDPQLSQLLCFIACGSLLPCFMQSDPPVSHVLCLQLGLILYYNIGPGFWRLFCISVGNIYSVGPKREEVTAEWRKLHRGT